LCEFRKEKQTRDYIISIRKVLLFMEEALTAKNVEVGENIVLYFFLLVMLSCEER